MGRIIHILWKIKNVSNHQPDKISMKCPTCDSKNVMTNLVAYHHVPSSHDDCNELNNTKKSAVLNAQKNIMLVHVGSISHHIPFISIHFISVALDSSIPEFLGSQPAKLTCDFRAGDCFVDGDLLKFKENI